MRSSAIGWTLAAMLYSPVLQAQLLIGQTSGFSGPVAAGVRETTEGARLFFDHVNANGGVNGQRIELISLDDKFDPALSAENARKLIVERNVVSLFLSRGTPHTQAIMPLLSQYKVPLVAPSTGAMVLHNPVHPWVFNVRATYQREAEKAVLHLHTIGFNRIALVQPDDSFGADCMEGAMRGFEKLKLQPVFVENFNRVKPNLEKIVALAKENNPQAIIFIGAASAVSEGTRLLRSQGISAQIVTVSNNASTGFIKEMGSNARGVVVTQVFPYERLIKIPLVKEAHDLAATKGMTEVTPAMLEGFAGAKVLVEGLKRAGSQPTRISLQSALNKLQKVDIGGLEISYSESDHSGLDFADLSIINSSGRFIR